MMKKNSLITKDFLEKAMSYSEYRALINKLLLEDKVTGDFLKNNDWILNYTKMNNRRMDRGETVFKEKEDLKKVIASISDKWIWLVITEGWCGDAAQIIPAFVKIVDLNPNWSIKFILRDENPKLMDNYLSNGSRSIPKLVVLNGNTLEEVGTWGPRPAIPQKMTMDHKESGEKKLDKYIEKLHAWYENDHFQAIQDELLESLKSWIKK